MQRAWRARGMHTVHAPPTVVNEANSILLSGVLRSSSRAAASYISASHCCSRTSRLSAMALAMRTLEWAGEILKIYGFLLGSVQAQTQFSLR